MLNERKEINKVLSGERWDKFRAYRNFYLLGRHYRHLGLDAIKVREEINNWAKQQNVSISLDLNKLITKVFSDNTPIIEDVKIYISKSDIYEIHKRFDRRKTKLLAFALLCYAKLNANSDGIIDVSMQAISKWTGIPNTDFYRNYGCLQELEDFGYINKLGDIASKDKKGSGNYFKKSTILKICVDCSNKGEYVFTDNNMLEEFESIMRSHSA